MEAKQKAAKKSGYALLVVMFLITAMSSFLAMLIFSSSQRAYTSTRLLDEMKAKAMAEAGCEYAYSVLSADWDTRYIPSAFTNSPN